MVLQMCKLRARHVFQVVGWGYDLLAPTDDHLDRLVGAIVSEVLVAELLDSVARRTVGVCCLWQVD